MGRDTDGWLTSCILYRFTSNLSVVCSMEVWGSKLFFFPTSFLYFWVLKQTSRRDNTVAIVGKNENFLCGPLVRTGEEVGGARKPPSFSVQRKFWAVRNSLQRSQPESQ